MEVKIAHCSDIHLKIDSSKYSSSEDSFLNILNECKRHKVELLLIAGDLFDDSQFEDFKLNNIKYHLEKFGIRTFISPGNHDPYTSDSQYNTSGWPANVYIFKNNSLSYVDLPDINVRVWGAAFGAACQRTSLLNKIKIPENSNFINVCVLHGFITKFNSNDYYNPITIENIRISGMNYIALGHIHKRSRLFKTGNTFYAYSGSAYSKGFNDTGEKGMYIATISENECNLEFVKTCRHSYEKVVIYVSDILAEENIISAILDKIKFLYKESYNENLYEIHLCGEVEENSLLDANYIENALKRDLFSVKVLDKTELKIDINQLILRNDFKSIFIKKALKLIESAENSEDKKLKEKALKIGLKAFREDILYNDN